MDYHIEKIASPGAIVGEGPVWNPDEQKLYWTDIQGGKLFKYNPKDGSNQIIHQGLEVGGFRFNEGGGLILGTWNGVMLWKSDEDFKWIKTGTFEGTNIPFRINDTTAGPDGSFYCGTDASNWKNDILFRVNTDSSIDIIDDGITLCNGMGFSPDNKNFYSTDTLAKVIYQWDYNLKTKSLSNKKILVNIVDEFEGLTDGMTIDSEGFIWSAIWGGSKVIRFDPDGKKEREIIFPATQTSCPMFGGKNLNELYVTTASAGTGMTKNEAIGIEPKGYDYNSYRGGDLFRVKLDIQGKLEYKTKF